MHAKLASRNHSVTPLGTGLEEVRRQLMEVPPPNTRCVQMDVAQRSGQACSSRGEATAVEAAAGPAVVRVTEDVELKV